MAEQGVPGEEGPLFEITTEVEDGYRNLRCRIDLDVDRHDLLRIETPGGHSFVDALRLIFEDPISQSIDKAYREGLEEGIERSKARAEWEALSAVAGAAGFSNRIQNVLQSCAEGEEAVGVPNEVEP